MFKMHQRIGLKQKVLHLVLSKILKKIYKNMKLFASQ